MGQFDNDQRTEAEGMAYLLPWLESRFPQFHVVPIRGQAPLCVTLQKTFGDIVMYRDDLETRTMETVEVKVERRTKTGSFFAETWSNNLINPGWVVKSEAVYLAYVFLEPEPVVYLMRMHDFKAWVRFNEWRLKRSEPKTNGNQKNQTVGVLVPINEIRADFKGPSAPFPFKEGARDWLESSLVGGIK